MLRARLQRGQALVLAISISLLLNQYGALADGGTDQSDVRGYPDILTVEVNALAPEAPAVVGFQPTEESYLSAACMIPAYYNRIDSIPLIFDDGSGENAVPEDFEAVTIELGSGGTDIWTMDFAYDHWSEAGVVVLVEDYEWALRSVPISAQLCAPMVTAVTPAFATNLSVELVIMAGDGLSEQQVPAGTKAIRLTSAEDLWTFQLDVYSMMGRACDYVVVTNPTDIDPAVDIQLHGLSLSAGLLAAYRGAVVQTGDLTGPRDLISTIIKAEEPDDVTYDQVVPYFHAVKESCWGAQEFMIDRDLTPAFLGLVGGPFALPDYILDIHILYHYWAKELHYVPTTAPYGNFSSEKPVDTYVKEDAAVGRILGDNILDTSLLLFRTFFYREFLPGGEYDPGTAWSSSSIMIDGHRLNQPEPGGPNISANVVWHPGEEVMEEFDAAGFDVTYGLPKNETDPTDTNLSVVSLMGILVNSSVSHIIAHGHTEMIRFEVGIDPDTGDGRIFALTCDQIRDLGPTAPFAIGAIACGSGTFSKDVPLNRTVPLSFVHAGAVAFHAPATGQAVCFWDQAPEGVASDMSYMMWNYSLNDNIAIGRAIADAKWDAFSSWRDAGNISHEDPATFHLFGDPALELYKPGVPFSDPAPMEVEVELDIDPSSIAAGDAVVMNFTFSDPATGLPIMIDWDRIEVGNEVFDGAYAEPTSNASHSFTLNEEGLNWIKISFGADGYDTYEATYLFNVEGTGSGPEDEDDEDYPIAALMVVVLGIVLIVLVYVYLLKASRGRKGKGR